MKAVVFDMYETLITVFEKRPYYSAEMAVDAGVSIEAFRKYWRSHENDRTLGKCDLRETLIATLQALDIRDEALLESMISRRLADQKRIFDTVRSEITGMLAQLKEMGLRIGLISNCYLEERDLIRASVLAPYFDVMMLSCEQGIRKPDPAIFERCLKALGTRPEETLYVGDGGSMELEQAAARGMQAVQACWFIDEDEPDQPCCRKDGFTHAEQPDDILRAVQDA